MGIIKLELDDQQKARLEAQENLDWYNTRYNQVMAIDKTLRPHVELMGADIDCGWELDCPFEQAVLDKACLKWGLAPNKLKYAPPLEN